MCNRIKNYFANIQMQATQNPAQYFHTQFLETPPAQSHIKETPQFSGKQPINDAEYFDRPNLSKLVIYQGSLEEIRLKDKKSPRQVDFEVKKIKRFQGGLKVTQSRAASMIDRTVSHSIQTNSIRNHQNPLHPTKSIYDEMQDIQDSLNSKNTQMLLQGAKNRMQQNVENIQGHLDQMILAALDIQQNSLNFSFKEPIFIQEQKVIPHHPQMSQLAKQPNGNYQSLLKHLQLKNLSPRAFLKASPRLINKESPSIGGPLDLQLELRPLKGKYQGFNSLAPIRKSTNKSQFEMPKKSIDTNVSPNNQTYENGLINDSQTKVKRMFQVSLPLTSLGSLNMHGVKLGRLRTIQNSVLEESKPSPSPNKSHKLKEGSLLNCFKVNQLSPKGNNIASIDGESSVNFMNTNQYSKPNDIIQVQPNISIKQQDDNLQGESSLKFISRQNTGENLDSANLLPAQTPLIPFQASVTQKDKSKRNHKRLASQARISFGSYNYQNPLNLTMYSNTFHKLDPDTTTPIAANGFPAIMSGQGGSVFSGNSKYRSDMVDGQHQTIRIPPQFGIHALKDEQIIGSPLIATRHRNITNQLQTTVRASEIDTSEQNQSSIHAKTQYGGFRAKSYLHSPRMTGPIESIAAQTPIATRNSKLAQFENPISQHENPSNEIRISNQTTAIHIPGQLGAMFRPAKQIGQQPYLNADSAFLQRIQSEEEYEPSPTDLTHHSPFMISPQIQVDVSIVTSSIKKQRESEKKKINTQQSSTVRTKNGFGLLKSLE
ncbi:hypothetical protein FGO68_gene12235 [Halteria grandinella]|uniref:Uncharacterized protein n=1 Tax=Halteria grandinella TaxID=5974 RepID=A0A8J8NW39_HALGN|nr:hypothetical protein FGO68_gene12235 [Halteria grandinella]